MTLITRITTDDWAKISAKISKIRVISVLYKICRAPKGYFKDRRITVFFNDLLRPETLDTEH
jgi:hypothetical protein